MSTAKFLPSFKQALIGAVALSASLFSSAAAMAAPITDYHLTVGYWDGTGANVNSMASDFSAAGITYDGNGLARQSHSADVSENAENLSVSLSLSTFNGESFSDHMLPSEQTAATWDGSVFDVGQPMGQSFALVRCASAIGEFCLPVAGVLPVAHEQRQKGLSDLFPFPIRVSPVEEVHFLVEMGIAATIGMMLHWSVAFAGHHHFHFLETWLISLMGGYPGSELLPFRIDSPI